MFKNIAYMNYEHMTKYHSMLKLEVGENLIRRIVYTLPCLKKTRNS